MLVGSSCMGCHRRAVPLESQSQGLEHDNRDQLALKLLDRVRDAIHGQRGQRLRQSAVESILRKFQAQSNTFRQTLTYVNADMGLILFRLHRLRLVPNLRDQRLVP
jgi:hypothetical protein